VAKKKKRKLLPFFTVSQMETVERFLLHMDETMTDRPDFWEGSIAETKLVDAARAIGLILPSERNSTK
jgi:hypothetical protein